MNEDKLDSNDPFEKVLISIVETNGSKRADYVYTVTFAGSVGISTEKLASRVEWWSGEKEGS